MTPKERRAAQREDAKYNRLSTKLAAKEAEWFREISEKMNYYGMSFEEAWVACGGKIV